jgi:nucleoid-associated protein YgaU
MAVADIRVLAAALAGLMLSGCTYVHFGRLPPGAPQLAQENSDLRLEKTILQQELAIAHKEGDALRTALAAGAGGGARENELASKLEATSRELADLRTRYAAMQEVLAHSPTASPGTGSAASATPLQTRLTTTEDQLAAALRDSSKLRDDNTHLRQDLDQARSENAALAVQMRDFGTRNRETQTALTQLNSELLAQREARARAEGAVEALREQLRAVIAQIRPPSPAPAVDGSRETTTSSSPAVGASDLRAPLIPGPATTLTATLSTNSKPGQTTATAGTAEMTAAAATEVKVSQFAIAPSRIHQVAAGDTLETIATKYYGSPQRSRLIYDANEALLRNGRRLTPGMKLVIPGEPNPGP